MKWGCECAASSVLSVWQREKNAAGIFDDCCSIDAGVASQGDASLLTHALV